MRNNFKFSQLFLNEIKTYEIIFSYSVNFSYSFLAIYITEYMYTFRLLCIYVVKITSNIIINVQKFNFEDVLQRGIFNKTF